MKLSFFWAAGAVIAMATPVAADDLQEIVVTARKRTEVLTTVPLSVSVHDAGDISRSSLEGLQTLAQVEPGLYFESLWGGGNAAPVLRGQSQPSTAGDNVGVFVDGVYQASRNTIDVELLDFERIEVVRGPQSTLYGRSSFAGAINYISARPTPSLTTGAALETGNGDYAALRGWLSGPLGSHWRGRLAASRRYLGGLDENGAAPTERLGGYGRDALAFTVDHADQAGDAWQARASLRWQKSRQDHPAAIAVTGSSYNCGARDSVSGLWSYFCGELPASASSRISPDIPSSRNESLQALLALEFDLGFARLSSDTSYFVANGAIFRDFDGSSEGDRFGVCTIGVNCLVPGGGIRLVQRLADVNLVSQQTADVRELTQEFRLRGGVGGRIDWLLGMLYAHTRDESATLFGADRGDLRAGEQLTALLPASPLVVGPVSQVNRFLVDDVLQRRVPQGLSITRTATRSIFAALDYRVRENWALRAEIRYNQQRESVNSLLANGVVSFGRSIPAQEFSDIAPRVSLQWHPNEWVFTYVSMAKGSRAGGVNRIPGLIPQEQFFKPETNWTTEFGWRLRDSGRRWNLSGAIFHVDWRDTQIPGFSNTPGVANLITTNTAGLETRGLEGSVDWRVGNSLSLRAVMSYVEPRFVAGSDDPSGRAFCGLTATNSLSSFCTVGPARSVGAANQLVPWLDGNFPGRTPELGWNISADASLGLLRNGAKSWLRADLGYQGNVFERPNNGAVYGERRLINMRFGVTKEKTSVELWVRNLTDERYIRAAASRGAVFFPTQPRPLDLIYGAPRQYGLTLSVER